MTTEQLRLRRPNALARSWAPASAEAFFSTWGWFWRSRLLLWGVGCCAVLLLGTSGQQWGTDPTGLSTSFGRLGNVLAAPAVRWDSIWYLQIAQTGYRTVRDTAFFPLYPALIRIVGSAVRSYAAAGVLISSGSLLGALVIIRKLTEVELGSRAANATVALLAFTPMAVFFSAVYTESLFLLLSAGMFYAGRRGRWATAGALGGLATMTRVIGVLLVVPFALMFWEQRRRTRPVPATRLLWIALIPAGALAFGAYLGLSGFDPLSPLHVQQQFWGHYFTGPLGGIRDGVVAAWKELRDASAGIASSPYQSQALLQLSVLVACGLALAATFRRLPPAYGAYAILGLLVPISSPTFWDPLRALDRYAAVLFPLFMAAGAWAVERGCVRKLVLLSTVPLVFFTIQFATWRFVA